MTDDLFAYSLREKMKQEAPLAQRIRPETLEEFVGQEKLLGRGQPLRRAIEEDKVGSSIFSGPPGTGKTTLVGIISRRSRCRFVQLNAVSTGVGEVRRVIQEAGERWAVEGRRTILFIDEIHRFNKAQQDALLAAVEDGRVIFLGATTENPFFSIIPPLLSRCRLYLFEPLTEGALERLLNRALRDEKRGLGRYKPVVDPAALKFIIGSASGDARIALNILEMCVENARSREGTLHIAREEVEKVLRKRILRYDRGGDAHYDAASALIKSIRGSHPDGALYWLARMLGGGEDPLFIARRLVISAAEDVGNADPQALQVAVAAAQAVHMIGMPEARIPLAQATAYLAAAPKSNAAYLAGEAAREEVESSPNEPVPLHLRNPYHPGVRELGYGAGYKYPHDYPGHFVRQDYLPASLKDRRFYFPSEEGFEKTIKERLNALWAGGNREGGGDNER